jgi:protein-S-isoprenylcysteine O-methyltransferase Ste14
MATDVLGTLILLGWLGLEVVLRAPGTASSVGPTASDRYSTPLLVAGYALAVVIPIVSTLTDVGTVGDLAWLGVAIGALGLIVRAWAMRTLGASYTRTLRTASAQTLVTGGPYRWIRHPGYAGSLLVWVGAALAFHSWVAAVAVATLLGVAYAWRIRSEERMLAVSFGEDYRRYAARTARVIPRLF